MPYIDSAGVKLNKNADLIIEADASGAVTSCRDAVTGTEYAGGSYRMAHVQVTNNSSNARSLTAVYIINGYAANSNKNVSIGADRAENIIAPSRSTAPLGSPVCTGGVSISGSYLLIEGDGTITWS